MFPPEVAEENPLIQQDDVSIPAGAEEETAMVLSSPEEQLALQEEQAAQAELEAEEAQRIEDEFQDKLRAAIKDIVRDYEIRDQPVRERLLRMWRKSNLFWDHIQNIVWDGLDYQSANSVLREIGETADEFDPYYYDKIINI